MISRFVLLFFLLPFFSGEGNKIYRETALKAEKWISSSSVITNKGKTWLQVPADSVWRNYPADSFPKDIYSGTSGVVLFYLELYNSTSDKTYLAEAESGAQFLINTLDNKVYNKDSVGLYTGLAGIGFTLDKVFLASNKKIYRDNALKCITLLEKSAQQKGNGVEWGGITDIIYGGAGIGEFLLYADEKMEDKAALPLAKKIADRLLESSVPDSSGGVKWPMNPEEIAKPRFMPNFSHGTAGVCYFLASMYEKTKEKKYLDAAMAGMKTLERCTSPDGLIFHHEPDKKDLFYLGWCHGPAGTARLYYKFYQITKEEKWMDKIKLAAKSMMNCGLPEKQTPGYWNNVSQCCGIASTAGFFLDLYDITKSKEYLDVSKRAAKILIDRASEEKGGLKWTQAEHRIKPDFLQAQTSYMQGGAGIGVLLLHLDDFENGKKPFIMLPDNPFSY